MRMGIFFTTIYYSLRIKQTEFAVFHGWCFLTEINFYFVKKNFLYIYLLWNLSIFLHLYIQLFFLMRSISSKNGHDPRSLLNTFLLFLYCFECHATWFELATLPARTILYIVKTSAGHMDLHVLQRTSVRPSRVMQKENFETLNFMLRFSKGETIKKIVCTSFVLIVLYKKIKAKDVPIALTNWRLCI